MNSAATTALRERPGRNFELSDEVSVVFSDIPVEMTIDEYRRSRPRPVSKSLRLRQAAMSLLPDAPKPPRVFAPRLGSLRSA